MVGSTLQEQAEQFRTGRSEGTHLVSNEPLSHKSTDILKKLSPVGIEVHIGSLIRAMDRLAVIPQLRGCILVDIDRGTYLGNMVILELGSAYRQKHGKHFSVLEFCSLFSQDQFDRQFSPIKDQFSPDDQEIIHNMFTKRYDDNPHIKKTIREMQRTREDEPIGEPTQIFSQLLGEAAHPDIEGWLDSPEKINAILDAYRDGDIVLVNGDISDPKVWSVIDNFCQTLQTRISILDLSNVFPSWLSSSSIEFLHLMLISRRSNYLFDDSILVRSIPYSDDRNSVFRDELDKWSEINPFLVSQTEEYVPYIQTVADYQNHREEFKNAIASQKDPTKNSLKPTYDLIKTGEMQTDRGTGVFLSKSLVAKLS